MNIYFHGNCQMGACGRIMRESFPDWTINATEVQSVDLATGEAIVASCIHQADVIVTNPVGPDYRDVPWLGSAYVKATARHGTEVLLQEAVYFRAFTPEWFYIGMPVRFPIHGMLYQNVIAAEMALHGYATEEIVHRVTSILTFDPAFIARQFETSLETLRRREEQHAVDLTVSDIFDGPAHAGATMNTFDHPSRQLLVTLLNRLMRRISSRLTVKEEGSEPLGDFIIPTTPAVAAATGRGLCHDGVVIGGQLVPFARYLVASVEEYRAMDQHLLAAALIGDHAVRELLVELRRSERGAQPRQSAASAALVRGLYRVLLGREPSAGELLGQVQAAATVGGAEPFVPMMMRHRPTGSLPLRARKDHLSHAHALQRDQHGVRCRQQRRP